MRCLSFILTLLLLTSSYSSASVNERIISSYSEDCLQSAKRFLRKNPIKSGPIQTDKDSLYSHIPDHESFRAKMLAIRPSVTNYTRDHKEKYGKVPKFRDVLEFYIRANAALVAHIKSGIGSNKDLNTYLGQAARAIELPENTFSKYKQMYEHPEMKARLLEPFYISNDSQRKILSKFNWPQYKGDLGELDVALRLRHVVASTVFFKKMDIRHKGTSAFNKLLSDRVEEVFSSIKPEDIPELIKKYPRVFREKDDISNEEILRRSRVFIDGKEIDIVLKKGDKYILVEVKNYKNPIGSSDVKISAPGTKKKSILDQQIENIEILELLGLRDTVYPSVAFLRGVKPSALEILESYGISVLARVHDNQRE